MIVSCPSCSTGYKLDESRITGRGVRITCPKCKHVFVVYKEAPAQPMPKAQASASLVEAAEDERPADPDGPTSFFHTGAGGLRPADLSAPTRAPAPALPPARAAEPAAPPPAPPRAPPPAPPAQPPAPVRAPLDVHALDFRKVGIPAWKVKGRIGLVFDFNDFKTLSRYIADGRVTPSDRLSHDGKTWTEIGALGDLEAHFVKVYQDAEDALAAAAAAKLEASAATAEAFKDDEPTNIMGMSGMDDEVVKNLAAPGPSPLASFQASAPARILPGADLNALAAAAVEAESRAERPPREPEGPRFVDPFEKKRAEGKPKAAAAGPSKQGAGGPPPGPKPAPSAGRSAPPPAPSRAPAALGAFALLALLAAGAWWFTRPEAPAPSPAPTPA
ncbi:MAG: zinc-ribbon domain-containing protein, partial [Deltaproteobacteria bacterium]|nr:zinc-ribbon domain-containing protein [Deltaproteobacteria bacterium]